MVQVALFASISFDILYFNKSTLKKEERKRMKFVLSAVLFALVQFAAAVKSNAKAGSTTGVILSTYFYCEFPCEVNDFSIV